MPNDSAADISLVFTSLQCDANLQTHQVVSSRFQRDTIVAECIGLSVDGSRYDLLRRHIHPEHNRTDPGGIEAGKASTMTICARKAVHVHAYYHHAVTWPCMEHASRELAAGTAA